MDPVSRWEWTVSQPHRPFQQCSSNCMTLSLWWGKSHPDFSGVTGFLFTRVTPSGAPGLHVNARACLSSRWAGAPPSCQSSQQWGQFMLCSGWRPRYGMCLYGWFPWNPWMKNDMRNWTCVFLRKKKAGPLALCWKSFLVHSLLLGSGPGVIVWHARPREPLAVSLHHRVHTMASPASIVCSHFQFS